MPTRFISISECLMPNYDLSSATLGRVANQNVDLLRIANQTVWSAPSGPPPIPTFSIFGGSAIPSLTSHDDLHANAYVANQFHRASGLRYEIVDVGIYVPAGSSLLGRSGSIGVMLSANPYASNTVYPNQMAVLGGPTAAPLVEGWNWHPLPSPVYWEVDKPYVLAGYSIDTHYLFNNTISENGISSAGLEFDLSPTNADGMWRSWFTRQSDGQFITTSSRSYGIDLRCRITDQRLLSTFIPGSFNNPGLYSYGMRLSRTSPFVALGSYFFHRTADAPSSVTGRLYVPSTQVVLASGVASTSGVPDQTWMKVPYSDPYEVPADTECIVANELNGSNSFDSGAGLPLSEAGFTVYEGRYLDGGGFPTSTWSGLHGIGLNWKEPQ
jgi:hypothetical protein